MSVFDFQTLGLRRLEKDTFLNLDDPSRRDRYAAAWTSLRNDLLSQLSALEGATANASEKQQLAKIRQYAPMGARISKGVINVYEVCFSAALASIGMNANLLHVFRRLFKPLVLIMLVFVVDLALWWFTHGLIHY